MRAREFITEDGAQAFDALAHDESTGRRRPRDNHHKGHPQQWYADVSPGAMRIDNIDKYYDLYRLGMIMAGGIKDDVADEESWVANSPILSGYTDEDDEKIKYAAKRIGGVVKNIAPPGSREPKDTQKQSPIKAFKGYPR
jgi:hypothetical protein